MTLYDWFPYEEESNSNTSPYVELTVGWLDTTTEAERAMRAERVE